MTTITADLPDELAKDVEEAGLLASDVFEEIMREALRRKAGREMLEMMEELHAANFPPMTMDEIQAEVNAVRAERRKKREMSGKG